MQKRNNFHVKRFKGSVPFFLATWHMNCCKEKCNTEMSRGKKENKQEIKFGIK